MQWLYQYTADDSGWAWSDQQIDPITGQILQLDSATGEYVPIDPVAESSVEVSAEPPVYETPPTDEPTPPADDATQPTDDPTAVDEIANAASAEPADAAPRDAAMFDKFGAAKPAALKADKNGLYPHSRLGGNPATPLMGGGFSSRHADGVNFALGDGSVRFIAESASAGLLGRLANRADGQTIDAKEW